MTLFLFVVLDRLPLSKHRAAILQAGLAEDVRVTSDQFLRYLIKDVIYVKTTTFARDFRMHDDM